MQSTTGIRKGISRFTVPGKSKFVIFYVEIFSPKQKANQILPATLGKIRFRLFKKK